MTEYIPGSIETLGETLKELEVSMAGTNVSVSDVNQIVTISAPDLYTKTETNTALALKANSGVIYTKAESDSALTLRAFSGDVYTQTEMNTSLNAKANSGDVYTKTDMDASLASKAPALSPFFKEAYQHPV